MAVTLTLLALAVLSCGAHAAGTRAPILAGAWYPADPVALRSEVSAYLDSGGKPDDAVVALIVPHAGYAYSGETAGRGYAAVRGRAFKRVVLLGPSHRHPFAGAALPDEEAWRTPLGSVPIDRETVDRLARTRGFQILPAAHAQEHSIEIEIPFLQVALQPGFRIVPIVIGRLDEETCRAIARGIGSCLDRGSLLIVSSDFTHYGPSYGYLPFRDRVPERIRDLDEGAIRAIEAISPGEFERYRAETRATICGAEPIRVLLTHLKGRGGRFAQLGYMRSGDLMSDFTNSVSYVSMAYAPPGEGEGGSARSEPRILDREEQEFLLRLARETILARLRGANPPRAGVPARFAMDSPLREVRGVFVTLNLRGLLRGCMGNIAGTHPLADGVAAQAAISAFEDPRFPPLGDREASEVTIEISVLTPLRRVNGPDEIVVGRHGVVLEKGRARAVFLPQVATEQGWDRDTMLSQLSRKAGLPADAWRSGATFEVFEAQVFGEEKGR